MKHIIIILCVIAGICSSCNDMLENITTYEEQERLAKEAAEKESISE